MPHHRFLLTPFLNAGRINIQNTRQERLNREDAKNAKKAFLPAGRQQAKTNQPAAPVVFYGCFGPFVRIVKVRSLFRHPIRTKTFAPLAP